MPVWFAFNEDRPLAFFAGLWTTWTSTRKLAEGEVTADLFGFLTTDANAEVGAVHPKAMPVILTREEELETWLAAPWPEAARLQRPLPDGSLRIVARGEKKDEAAPITGRRQHDSAAVLGLAHHRRRGRGPRLADVASAARLNRANEPPSQIASRESLAGRSAMISKAP